MARPSRIPGSRGGALNPAFSRRRRRLLQAGVGGTLLLGLAPILHGASRHVPADDGAYTFLRSRDRRLLTAVLPVLLAGALPEAPDRAAALRDILATVDRYLAQLGAADRADVRRLFDLLTLAPARVLLAGVWRSWDAASPAAIAGFLSGWQHSGVTLFHGGYRVLHDLSMAGWYGSPAAWPVIGYTGPPDIQRPDAAS